MIQKLQLLEKKQHLNTNNL